MIYLIDDKKSRQKDFGWTEEKFAQYASYLTPLYNIDDVANIGENLYNDGNIILYHESFLDFTGHRDKAVEQRNKLTEKVDAINGLSVAFFSGSQSSRSLHENVAHVPVAILYQNLEVLIHQDKQQSKHLRYLLFGETPEIEEKLNEKLTQANKEIETDAAVFSGNNLFIRTNLKYIQNAIESATERTIFNDVSDENLSEKINEWLGKIAYDNIFIPLCFGQTLSDYNGLRLATHIRCNPSPNQLKRIFIYSFVGIDYLLDNEYFNILKTKNVQLVAYSKKAFEAAVNEDFTFLQQDDLSQEINKLKLDPPLNYVDSHSIANEWAIHQWAKTVGCDETDELAKVFQNIETNLYFKYLRTTNPISEIDRISPEKLKINCEGKPKALLIDDEAEKGWYEIFAYLLGDLNEIYIDYLGDDFKNKNQEEVIDKSMQKITEDEIDVVILDFRLNPNDFIGSNPKDISSIRLLKKIKGLNPGIQVIIFSATNKIWNLQALQEAGADGFIFKDGNENIHPSIKFLANELTSSLHKASTLKPIYKSFDIIKNNAINLGDTFKINLANNLSICFELLLKSFETTKYINYAYLQLFLIVEELIKEDSVFEFGSNCYVVTPSLRYLVLSQKDPTQKNSAYKSALTWSNGHYKVGESEFKRSIDTNFKMSSILLFRNGLPTSGSENWSKIYSIRNKKAAHPEVGIVEFSEINMLSKFLEFILDESNINPIDSNQALTELSPDEQVENLKKIWGAK
ncbi:response regulator [Cyclobacterium sp. SYSU L10401]|uniref:response regulator n=1 Tax=Cyclobacterium sp. SYSU L10401 TaxID=2678657 RepID=UPI0013D81567|nr:response regulator [Cyclobacterium sp. SYSU L10401]